MEGRVDLSGWFYTEMVHLSADSYPFEFNHLLATGPGVEPTTY